MLLSGEPLAQPLGQAAQSQSFAASFPSDIASAQSGQTSWAQAEAFYLAYLSTMAYLSAASGYGPATQAAPVPVAPPPAAMSAAEAADYLYRNGARALTVPAPGQRGSEVYSDGARLLTVPAPGQPGSELYSEGARLLTVPFSPPVAAPEPAGVSVSPAPSVSSR